MYLQDTPLCNTRSIFYFRFSYLFSTLIRKRSRRNIDTIPSADLSYEEGAGALAFAASASGMAKTCVWLSDARFADFSAQVDFSSSESPTLRLGTSQFVDPEAQDANGSCVLPARAEGSLGGRILVQRVGDHATLTLGSAHSECPISAERVPVGVCASELGPVRVTLVSVTRTD